MSTARTIVKSAAVGGGAAIGVLAAGAGVVGTQAIRARRDAGPRRTVPPYSDGRYGQPRGISLRLAMLGDSLATGLGADSPAQTPGAILATRLAERSGRPVVLSTIAMVGARSDSLASQVERAMIIKPNVVVMLVGANDITGFRPLHRQVRKLRSAILALRESGAQVVLGTCPDLSASTLIPAPSNRFAQRQSRRLAAMQTRVALQAGAITVSLADLLSQDFHTRPAEMFAADRFHPSNEGYENVAEVLAPAVLAAAGLGLGGVPARYEPPRTERLTSAIAQAVSRAGTVLQNVPHPPAGERRRLATLLQRRRAVAPS